MLKKLFKAQFFFKYQNLFRSKFVSLLNKLDKLDKKYRRFLLIVLDTLILILSALFINFIFSGSTLENFKILGFNSIFSLVIISLLVFYFSGQYTSITKYIRPIFIYKIAFRNLIVIGTFLIMRLTFGLNISLLRIYLLFWFVNTSLIIISRFTIKETLIFKDYLKTKKSLKVVIFGAGAAGAQLASSLILSGEYKIEAFLDDSPKLWGRRLSDIRIYPPDELYNLRENIDQILIAIPSLTNEKKRFILQRLKNFQIPVFKVPSIGDLTNGIAKIDSLIPIEVEDLLGRIQVDPDLELLNLSTKDSNICITGAGGSIGKEICRQIIKLDPKSLILIEINEFSLYKLEQEITNLLTSDNKIKIFYRLGNVCNYKFVNKVFDQFKIDIVYHAAAYKHVPLIESNPLQGIQNNIFSTDAICKAAYKNKLSKVIFISTDKAVRPTNVMGASKRLAEQILQYYSDKITRNIKTKNKSGNISTKFSIVRFGNVLGSSGSVVPLFKKQISEGGPITLTDKEVIRYFMTIQEAAQLVIQASSLSKGGDVFLLDMGKPIKIYDLAEHMIKLSGLKVKNFENPHGDIEIVTTGLRPGEKLYEELLIDGDPEKTKHPLIFKANEKSLSSNEIENCLSLMKQSIDNFDESNAISLLSFYVSEWENNL